MSDARMVSGLADALLDIADDPGRVLLLHQLLDRYCHRFRNRLNTIKLSLYLANKGHTKALPGESPCRLLTEMDARYATLERFINQLQDFARPSDLKPIVGSLGQFLKERVEKWRSHFECRGIGFRLVAPRREVVGRFDPSRLELGLDALALWRADVAGERSMIELSWNRSGENLVLEWNEGDGQMAATRSRGGLSDMSLPLLARVASLHGGSLTLIPRGVFGVRLSWPAEEAGANLPRERASTFQGPVASS